MENMKNFELDDEVFADVTGGIRQTKDANSEAADFDALGTVTRHIGGREYEVRFGDGGEVVATTETDGVISPGTSVGLFACNGGWVMKIVGF